MKMEKKRKKERLKNGWNERNKELHKSQRHV